MTVHANPPKSCDLCSCAITTEFSDVYVPRYGRWGNLCLNCVSTEGCSYGTGLGQRYKLTNDKFIKVEG